MLLFPSSRTDYYVPREQCPRGCATAATRPANTIAGGGGRSPQHEHLDHLRPFLLPFLLNLQAAQVLCQSLVDELSFGAASVFAGCLFADAKPKLTSPTPSFLLTVGMPLPILAAPLPSTPQTSSSTPQISLQFLPISKFFAATQLTRTKNGLA